MVTIKHIARKLNISVSTVGRALTDHPRISQETKDRVNRAATELGYIPNHAARMMRGGSSHLIGLLVPDIRSTFYSTVAHILSKTFKTEGYHLSLSITDDDPEIEREQCKELLSAQAAGIVVVPTANPKRETIELIRRLPHVQLLRRHPLLGDWFGLNDEQALFDATSDLLNLGHRKIAYIGDVIYPTGKARFKGFRRALATAKVTVDDALIELGPPDMRFGEDAVVRLLPRKPTAIITSSVLITLATVERLTAMGVKVPAELSLIGFGDGPWQQWWGPGLTTLALPAQELATECGHWILNRVKDGRQRENARAHTTVVPIVRVLRGSTAPLRT
jgi:LacI family transcriptional regulator